MLSKFDASSPTSQLDIGIDREALFHAVVYGRFIPDGVGLERGETFQVGT